MGTAILMHAFSGGWSYPCCAVGSAGVTGSGLCMLMHSCAYFINQCTSEYQILVQEIFIGNDPDSCEIINTILKLIYQTFGKYKTITKHSPYISFK